MGENMAIGAAIFGGMQAVGSIYSGYESMKEGFKQSDLIMEETKERASEKLKEIKNLRSTQTVQVAKSGIVLEGSPLLVMEESFNEGMKDVENIKKYGMSRASTARKSGRQAMTQGLIQGTTQAASGMTRYMGV